MQVTLVKNHDPMAISLFAFVMSVFDVINTISVSILLCLYIFLQELRNPLLHSDLISFLVLHLRDKSTHMLYICYCICMFDVCFCSSLSVLHPISSPVPLPSQPLAGRSPNRGWSSSRILTIVHFAVRLVCKVPRDYKIRFNDHEGGEKKFYGDVETDRQLITYVTVVAPCVTLTVGHC